MTTYADQPGFPPIKEALAKFAEADRIVMHNGLAYDVHALQKCYGETAIDRRKVYDTLVVGRLLDPEEKAQSLEAWGERLGLQKVEYDEWDRFTPEMVERCEVDVRLTARVYRRLEPRARSWGESVQLEHDVAWIIALQEQNGFGLDVAAARELEAELRQEQADIERELQVVFPPIFVMDGTNAEKSLALPKRSMKRWVKHPAGAEDVEKFERGWYVETEEGAPYTRISLQHFNPGSRKQIAERFQRKYGWKPKKFTPSGAPAIDESVLADLKYPEAKLLHRYLRVEKMLGQLADGDNAWLKMERNGRVHGKVNPNGAVTGRMTHWNPNLANVDKKDTRMRAVWVPRPGWRLVGADGSGLELRMLAHYLHPYDGGEYMRAVVSGTKEDGTDVHSRTVALLDLYDRDRGGKRIMYAYLYGAGDNKLASIIHDDADFAKKPRPKGTKKAIGAAAREKLEKGIVGLGKLVSKVKWKVRTKGYLVGLDGRHLYARSPHSALNLLLQGAGAIVMKKALVLFHEGMETDGLRHGERWAYCANVHDEVQIEAEPSLADEIGKRFAASITKAGEALKVRCPLDGDFLTGASWAETH